MFRNLAPLVLLPALFACGGETGPLAPSEDLGLVGNDTGPTIRLDAGGIADVNQRPSDPDGGAFDGGEADAGVGADLGTDDDAGSVADAGTAAPDSGSADSGAEVPLACAGFSSGVEVCEATPDECRVVFRDGRGCNQTCQSAGLECVASHRDDDDNAPLCARNTRTPESYGCAETGHRSDYCVCAPPAACNPDCTNRTCGSDGCGGSCGTCAGQRMCVDGTCAAEPPPPGPYVCREDQPTFNGRQNISRTIVLDRPGVYDYNNVLHEWTGAGSCNQNENQPYVLRIAASNVTVRNFAYRGAPDGIHIGTSSDGQGHSSGRPIENIVLENVTGWACEDALTTQFGVRSVTIRDSLFFPNPTAAYRDKLLQLNFGNVTIERSTFYGGGEGICVMFKGGQQLNIRDSCFVECDRAINGSTRNGIVGRISTSRSDLLSERNQGRFERRARTFWDPWKFYTGEGDVHIVAVQDQLLHNPISDMEYGATLVQR